jgi:hypothetical protein
MKTGLTVASESVAIEKVAINTIRTLCMDAVQAANSGHPGVWATVAPPRQCATVAVSIRPWDSRLWKV